MAVAGVWGARGIHLTGVRVVVGACGLVWLPPHEDSPLAFVPEKAIVAPLRPSWRPCLGKDGGQRARRSAQMNSPVGRDRVEARGMQVGSDRGRAAVVRRPRRRGRTPRRRPGRRARSASGSLTPKEPRGVGADLGRSSRVGDDARPHSNLVDAITAGPLVYAERQYFRRPKMGRQCKRTRTSSP